MYTYYEYVNTYIYMDGSFSDNWKDLLNIFVNNESNEVNELTKRKHIYFFTKVSFLENNPYIMADDDGRKLKKVLKKKPVGGDKA